MKKELTQKEINEIFEKISQMDPEIPNEEDLNAIENSKDQETFPYIGIMTLKKRIALNKHRKKNWKNQCSHSCIFCKFAYMCEYDRLGYGFFIDFIN